MFAWSGEHGSFLVPMLQRGNAYGGRVSPRYGFPRGTVGTRELEEAATTEKSSVVHGFTIMQKVHITKTGRMLR